MESSGGTKVSDLDTELEHELDSVELSSDSDTDFDFDFDIEQFAQALASYKSFFDEMDHLTVDYAKTLARRERERAGLDGSSLVYGEIEFLPFAIALQKLQHKYQAPFMSRKNSSTSSSNSGKFYDVGSGTVKPTIAAALLHDWEVCAGVEILADLYDCSQNVAKRRKTLARSYRQRLTDYSGASIAGGEAADAAVF